MLEQRSIVKLDRPALSALWLPHNAEHGLAKYVLSVDSTGELNFFMRTGVSMYKTNANHSAAVSAIAVGQRPHAFVIATGDSDGNIRVHSVVTAPRQGITIKGKEPNISLLYTLEADKDWERSDVTSIEFVSFARQQYLLAGDSFGRVRQYC